jgi:hypothetical protein
MDRSAPSGRIKAFLRRVRGPLGAKRDTALIACEVCRSRTVNPVDWREHDATRWWVVLRCGACAWSREAVITDAEAQQLERDLEPGLRDIAMLAERLDRDLICPADFSAGSRR